MDRGPIAFTLSGAIRTVDDGPNAGDPTARPLIAQGEEPAWSPDGARIAYWRGPPGGPFTGLVVASADGTGAQDVARVEPNGDIVTVSATGEAAQTLVEASDEEPVRRPIRMHGLSWAPDGRALRLVVHRNDFTIFERIDLTTRLERVRRVIARPGLLDVEDVAWSQARQLVAFSVDVTHVVGRGCRRGERRVYVARLGVTTSPVRVWPRTGICGGAAFEDRAPAFSPDGRSLLLTRRPGGGPIGFKASRILRVAITATGRPISAPREVAPGLHNVGWPAFSPDGERIAYVIFPASHAAVGGLGTMQADGTDRQRLLLWPFTALGRRLDWAATARTASPTAADPTVAGPMLRVEPRARRAVPRI